MTIRSNSFISGTGEVLQAFAAIVRNGLILLIGDIASQYQKEVISGMDYSTRLLVNLHHGSARAISIDQNTSDLRVAIHQQKPEEFLTDIRHHLMNMVVTDEDFSSQLAEQIESMLVEGGCWIILNAGALPDSLTNAFYGINTGTCHILVKRNVQQANVRRGGRRSRLAGEQ